MSSCPALTVAAALLLLGSAAAAPPASAPAASVHPELWPAATPAVDAGAKAFVEQLLAHMTLEEKVGQMIQADIASISPEELRTYKLGSILAGGGAAPGDNVHATPQAWLNLTDDYYRASLTANSAGHPPIPILFGIDAVHGHAKVVGSTIFPHNVALGAAHDPDLVRRIGVATAEEVAATGIDWTFAPTVAVARDVRWGRSYESYSESPELVAAYAAAMVTGLQGERDTPQFMAPGHTLSSVKHFLGDGGTLGGRDQGNTILPEAQLCSVHGAGYPAAIKAGALIVMASYNSWNGVKLHANHYLLTDILKGRLGFNGFVVGDWNAHEQVPGCTKYQCAAAVLAGVDMLMAPDGWRELYKNTLSQVRSGEIPQARIDDAVQRILRVKTVAGMFKRPAPKQRSDAGDFTRLGSADHRALAREAVRKSLVLLKNDHGILPLNPHARILVAGGAADSIGAQTGGWTIDWQGDHNSNEDFPGGTSIFGGIQAAVAAGGGSAVLSKEGRFTEKPDAAIVVFGEGPYAEFQGDRENLEFSPNDAHDLELLRRLHAEGVPTVAVFLSGRPLWVNPEINASDAFVAAWLPGSEGGGVADVLFRSTGREHYDFTGRLAFSWPETAVPVTYDAAGNVSGALFPRGWGLDYHRTVNSPQLSEDPRIPPYWVASQGSLFHAGHVTAPWSIFVADDSAEVHLTTARQESPRGSVVVASEPDGSAVAWTGTQSGMFTISGRAGDMRPLAAQGLAIDVRYRVDRVPTQRVKIGVRCTEPLCGTQGGAMLDVTQIFKSAQPGNWRTLSIPLSCFTAAGADLAGVVVPFAVETSGPFGLTISEVRLGEGTSGPSPKCLGTT
ncbi:MAG TPA: glycoside hydrolase family 3 N-terminal domain-containing protein [Steroidobacteraceae bacterium]|nr:glycoside hydrolase family 3 N-terminal domain-containing protein [Steroidobacteraceae bacterium]